MKALGKFVLLERIKEEGKSSLIETPEQYKQASPFQRGKILSKGKQVSADIEVGDEVLFQLFNAASIKGMTYHIHQDYILAKYV